CLGRKRQPVEQADGVGKTGALVCRRQGVALELPAGRLREAGRDGGLRQFFGLHEPSMTPPQAAFTREGAVVSSAGSAASSSNRAAMRSAVSGARSTPFR